MLEGYDVAQICINGHVSNDSTVSFPEACKRFCDICGESTLTACLSCRGAIRGKYYTPGVLNLVSRYRPPAFCTDCGNPYPWTSRRIETATTVSVELGGLTNEEAAGFKKAVEGIVRDTPETQLSASRLQKYLGKFGEQARGAIRDILVDIASETAKRAIWPK